ATLGGIFVAVSTISTQHFKKWRATALTLAMGSQTLSVLFMPQLTTYFIFNYGTPEAFLLLGAFTLNAFPAALALRSPPWATAQNLQKPALVEHLEMETEILQRDDDESPKNEAHTQHDRPSRAVHDLSATVTEASSIGVKEDTNTFRNPSPHVLRKTLKLLTSPLFHVDAFSFAIQMYVTTTFIIVHVDLSRDKNIEVGYGVYLMHAYTVGDMFFRVIGGLLLDRHFLSLESVFTLSFVGSAIACEWFVWSSYLLPLLLLSLCLGACQGLIISLPTILLLNDFKGHSTPMMLGTLRFIGGLLLMTRPSLL
ncbi:uncharacterized protein ISCGN_006082, partial [Ixodes scapularis]